MLKFLTLIVLASSFHGADAESAVRSRIALLHNGSNNSATTSNAVEGHIRRGFELAIEELGSKKYEYTWIDVGEKTETTVVAADKIIAMKPDLIVGPSNSFQVLALLQILRDQGISAPLITPTATSTDILKYSNVLLASNSNRAQAQAIFNAISKEGTNGILVVEIKDCPYCSNFVSEFKSFAKAMPIEVVSIEEREIQTSEKLNKAYPARTILVPALEVQTAQVIDRMFSKNNAATFWGADGVGSLARFVRNLEKIDLKFKWLSHYAVGIKTAENEAFVRRYRKIGLTDPVDTSAFYYEALKFGVQYVFEPKALPKVLKTVTGLARIENQQIVRGMPLMELKENEPVLSRLIEVQK